MGGSDFFMNKVCVAFRVQNFPRRLRAICPKRQSGKFLNNCNGAFWVWEPCPTRLTRWSHSHTSFLCFVSMNPAVFICLQATDSVSDKQISYPGLLLLPPPLTP